MFSKSLQRVLQTIKSSRFRYAAVFAFLVLALVFSVVSANGPRRPPHPQPQPHRPMQQGQPGMWRMKMPHWRPWYPMQPVPKIKIIAVDQDNWAAFETEDFPENKDFIVTMGKIYTRGVNGIEVGSFNSEDGSAQQLRFPIPEELYGQARIAIRAESTDAHPYFAFNWFYNTDAKVETAQSLELAEPAEAPAAEAAEAAANSIVDVAVADGRFETLVTALTEAGLVETLAGKGVFTVFAPTDDAFAALPEGTLDSLLQDPTGALSEVLLYHVVEGSVPAATVVTLDSATTLQGEEVAISVVDGEVFLNETVKVLITDVQADNGLIHVIDGVLIPPSIAESSAEAEEGTGGAEETEEAVPVEGLAGVVWQWTEFTDPVQGTLEIDAPEQYTVEFTDEGLVAVKADCNNGNGTYIAGEDGSIDIAIGAVTLALCAPESLSDQFLQYLGDAVIYFFEDDDLFLDLPVDAGTLRFVAGAAAEAPAEGEAETPAEEEAAASVTGTVTYLARIALPDDAVVTVQIQDTSLADAPAVVIGEQVIATEGQQVPIAYEVTYDPEDIQESNTYTMSARIEDAAGNLLFINDTAIPVITGDNPTEDVEIVTVSVGAGGAEESETPPEGEETEAAPLTGVVWQWTEFTDPVQGTLSIEDPQLYTVEFFEDGTVGIKADCNNGSGSYEADEAGGIDITVGAVTLALCGEDSLSDQFLQYLDAAVIYFFDADDLLMDLPVDSGTLRFAAAEEAEAGAQVAAVASTLPVSIAAVPAAGGGGDGNGAEESTVPSFKICSVVRDESVSIVTENFPADQVFMVKMGPAPAYRTMQMRPMHPRPMPYQAGPMKPSMGKPPMGKPMGQPGGAWMKPVQKVWIPYYEAGTLETGEGGQLEATFEIPAQLAGTYRISIMMRTEHMYPYISYNWFYNNTADVCDGNDVNSDS